MEADFSLCNAPQLKRPERVENSDRRKQRALFAGLDCLAGQLDLFETDGQVDQRRDKPGLDQ